MRKLPLIVLTILLSFTPFVSFSTSLPVQAETLEEKLERIEQELAAIRLQKQNLNSQITSEQQKIGAYSGEIGKLRADVEELQLTIAEFDLQIQQLEAGISILEEEIEIKLEDIEVTEQNANAIEGETWSRIKDNYMLFRSRGRSNVDILPTSESSNDYFKDSRYNEIIQNKANKVIRELLNLKKKLELDKQELEEKMITVRRDKLMVDEQKAELTRAQTDLEAEMEGYYTALYRSQSTINNVSNVLGVKSEEEARKMAEAERIRQEIFNSFISIPAGQYVLAGTQIGNQGSTGWSTGPHLHLMAKYNGGYRTPCDFLPYAVSSEEGSCGWGSGLQWPLKGSFYYTSRFYGGGNDSRCFWYNGAWSCSNHLGIDIAHSIWNAPVYAAQDGWMYKGVDQYGALYIIICEDKNNCNNGMQTGYWHLSAY